MPYDIAWFKASLFGAPYADISEAQYDFALTMAEAELADILCWCPKLYPGALSIKISLLLSGAGVGVTDDPSLVVPGGEYEAYVTEDEVFDVRRKYKVVERNAQVTGSSPASQLQRMLDTCKPPLGVGAFIATRVVSAMGGSAGCCGSGIADKAEWNHGGQ